MTYKQYLEIQRSDTYVCLDYITKYSKGRYIIKEALLNLFKKKIEKRFKDTVILKERRIRYDSINSQ